MNVGLLYNNITTYIEKKKNLQHSKFLMKNNVKKLKY